MAKTKKQPEAVTLDPSEYASWSCGPKGRCGEDPENANIPEVRIITTAHRASDTGEIVGYTCKAERRTGSVDDAEGWAEVFESEERKDNHIDAWRPAARAVIDELRREYREILSASEEWRDEIGVARHLLLVVRAEIGRENARIREKARPEFAPVIGDDLLLCLKLADAHFANLDTRANVYFRMRTPADTKGWTSGRNAAGDAVTIPGKAEKCSPDKADMLEPLLGWTPDFIVTICAQAWEDAKPDQRRGIVHHLLSQCGCADDKLFIAKPDLAAFGATVRELGPESLPGATGFVHAAIKGAALNDQLAQMDLFSALDLAADVREAVRQGKPRRGRMVDNFMQRVAEEAVGSMRDLCREGGIKSIGIQAGDGPMVTVDANGVITQDAPDAERFELTPEARAALDDQPTGDEPDEEFAHPDPEPVPPVEERSTDPSDELILAAVLTACTARAGSADAMEKARLLGQKDAQLRHAICVAFHFGISARKMGDHTVAFNGKSNDPRVKIVDADKKVVREIAGPELLALVRFAFGIGEPVKESEAVAAVATA